MTESPLAALMRECSSYELSREEAQYIVDVVLAAHAAAGPESDTEVLLQKLLSAEPLVEYVIGLRTRFVAAGFDDISAAGMAAATYIASVAPRMLT